MQNNNFLSYPMILSPKKKKKFQNILRSRNFTCSILTVNGPFDWHSGQEPTFTSEYEFWKNGPKTAPHLLQSYFTCCNWGKTPERRVTTPPIRIMVFKWICLQISQQRSSWNQHGQWKKERKERVKLGLYGIRCKYSHQQWFSNVT